MPFRFFAPPTLESMISKRDIKGLKALLVKTFPSDDCRSALKALAELGFELERDEVGAIIAILNRDFAQIAAIGVPAITPLVVLLKDRKTYEKSFRIVHNVDDDGELCGDSYEMIDNIRNDAENALIALGSDAVPGLVEILKREGENLGYALKPVLSILIEIGDPRAMDGFLHLLKSRPTIDVWNSSIFWSILPRAVRKYKDKRVIPYCRRILSEHNLNSMVRMYLENTLKELGETVKKR